MIIEGYRRREASIKEAQMEMHLAGVRIAELVDANIEETVSTPTSDVQFSAK